MFPSNLIKSCQVVTKAKSVLWQLTYLEIWEIFKYILDMPNENLLFLTFLPSEHSADWNSGHKQEDGVSKISFWLS